MNDRPSERTPREVRICVFAKPPVPGRVNTRLVPALGADGAARLAGAFLEDTLALATSFAWARTIVATTDPLPPSIVRPADVDEWPQGEGDLGARVERVLQRALGDAPAALALGVDSPGLPAPLLEEARRALADAGAVIGPATDGGFYTIGLTRLPEGLLRGLTWSADTTYGETLARLRAFGVDPVVLPEWYDVDVPADLDRLVRDLRAGSIAAPRTEAVLRALGRLRTST